MDDLSSFPLSLEFAGKNVNTDINPLEIDSYSLEQLNSTTTSLKFVQDRLNLKVFENGTLVETVISQKNKPVPNIFKRLSIFAFDSPDTNLFTDATCLNSRSGIGI